MRHPEDSMSLWRLESLKTIQLLKKSSLSCLRIFVQRPVKTLFSSVMENTQTSKEKRLDIVTALFIEFTKRHLFKEAKFLTKKDQSQYLMVNFLMNLSRSNMFLTDC